MPVALADLAELAGMPEEALCDVARSHGCTLRKTAGRLRGRWEEIERALAPNLRARASPASACVEMVDVVPKGRDLLSRFGDQLQTTL